jgi:hypothetical protein
MCFLPSAGWLQLNDQPLTLAFINGLHVFQQSLKDFMHVESFVVLVL